MIDTVLYGHEGNVLPAKYWPCENPRAALLVVHGLGEHCGRYAGMAQALNACGIEVWGYDQRGHGTNPLGPRGYARVADLEKDSLSARTGIREKRGLPLFLLGHSMGGGLSLYTMLHSQPDVKAAVICSPWIELVKPLPELPAKILKKHPGMLGKAGIKNGIPETGLCHDPAVTQAYGTDPLVHDHISFALAADMLNAADYSLTHGDRLLVPMLLLHGDADGICSPEGTKIFAAQCEKARLEIFPGAFHEIHNEPDCREAMFSMIADFIGQNL